jgi:hypothetical protein
MGAGSDDRAHLRDLIEAGRLRPVIVGMQAPTKDGCIPSV